MNRTTHRPPSALLRPLRNYLAAIVAMVLVATGLVLTLSAPAQAATHEVSGSVFRDFNSNGARDTNTRASGLASDTGLAGVTVTATDGKNAVVGTGTTAANGSYTLDVVNPSSADVRITFTGLPAGYESSFHGDDSGTSVQFVTVGSAPVTNVDFAVNAPEDFTQNIAAPLVTAIHSSGLRTAGANAGIPSLVSVPWTVPANGDGNDAGRFGNRTTLGTVAVTGSLWGESFQRTTGDLFASAVLRRHAELGPLGLGGIYRVPNALLSSGAINPAAANTAAPWLDVTTLGVNVGTIDESARGLGAPSQPSRDPEAYAKVGKVGIGGIAVSSDNKTLYFVNLFDKKLYAVDIATKTLVDSYDLGLAAGERPWAVSVHRDTVLTGFTATGEADQATSPADLDFVVRRAPESSLDDLADDASTVLRHDLGYTRGSPYNTQAARFLKWHPWTDAFVASDMQISGFVGASWAQAIVSDIAFDTAGEMIIGLQDRFSLQSGNRNWGPDTGSNQTYESLSMGDTLMASAQPDGTYQLENNGQVSGRTGAGKANQGPGGREFFNDSNVNSGDSHQETGLGGLTTIAGIDQVVATAFDTTQNVRTAGNSWLNLTTGSQDKGYQHTNDGGYPTTTPSFQKAGGLGDVQALANLAPLEIGNRVWFDADQDGVQDADEPAIDGVKVELFAADSDGAPTGSVISTTTTAGGGEYYFDVDPDERYVVVFTPPSSGNWVTDDPRFGTVPWADLTFTPQAQGGNPAVDSDVDADGQTVVETGGPGQNDHTIDAGLIANTEFTVQKVIDETGGAAADGQEFTINLAAKDFRDTTFALPQTAVTLTEDETSVPIQVPVGTLIRLTEADASDYDSVTISAPAGATGIGGYYLVESRTPSFAFRVSNKLFKPGGFTVTKAVSGDFDLDSPELADAEFTVNYTYPGASGYLTLNAANGWTATADGLPYGAEVTLTETVIDGHGPSVEFGTPQWKVGNGPNDTASSTTLTIGNGTVQEVVLTNPTDELLGGFDLTKVVSGVGAGRVPDDFEFTAEYSTNNGTTWTELDAVTKADPSTDGPDDLPVGTKVLIREVKPADLVDVDWVAAVFSGTGVTPATDDDPASFVIAENGPIAVTLTNTTSEINGEFALTKDVTGPGEPLLTDGHGFTINWTLNGDSQDPITLTNRGFFTSAPIAAGSKITLTEVTPTGGLPDGATWGTPVLRVDDSEQANGAEFTIGEDTSSLEIVLDNPTNVVPEVEITKGDGDAKAGTIAHEADTVGAGEFYTPGESRDVVIKVKNPGPEPLREVTLTDRTRSGGDITDLRWTFPDGSTVAADWDASTSTWSAKWAATFAPGVTEWDVDDVITGTATLKVDAADQPHQDRVTVDAEGAYSGKPVDDQDDYNAFTADLQVIKYDGTKADPAVKDADGGWIVPGKPLADAAQDANDAAHAVPYVADQANKVRWVVTNTGPTWLTEITLADVTGAGPSIGADWTADLSAFGGPAAYSFVKDGAWKGLLPPRASFFATGSLTLPTDTAHHDTVTVTAVPIVPGTGDDGRPSDEPQLDGGKPVLVLDKNDKPIVLSDDDPFHAVTPKPVPTPTPPGVSPDQGVAPDDANAPDDDNGLLPDTGSGLSGWGPLGGLLIALAGVGFIIASRRREPAPETSGRHRH